MNAVAMSITHGPFKGAEFDPSEGFARDNGDGTVSTNIRLAILTQHFLEQFPPTKGWSVAIHGEFVQVDMVPLPRRDDPLAPATHVPTARFVATLTSPEGRVIGTASSLWTIQGPTDWEKGETNARSRLYEAMGLQSRFGDGAEEVRRLATSASITTLRPQAPVKPVSVTPLVDDAPKAEHDGHSTESAVEPAAKGSEAKDRQDAEPKPEELRTEAKAKPAKATKRNDKEAEGPAQSTMDVGEADALQMPPPAAMLAQIQRLAKLMQKPMPTLDTRQQAMDFLAELQGKGG